MEIFINQKYETNLQRDQKLAFGSERVPILPPEKNVCASLDKNSMHCS